MTTEPSSPPGRVPFEEQVQPCEACGIACHLRLVRGVPGEPDWVFFTWPDGPWIAWLWAPASLTLRLLVLCSTTCLVRWQERAAEESTSDGDAPLPLTSPGKALPS